jgi:hypothetical protein
MPTNGSWIHRATVMAAKNSIVRAVVAMTFGAEVAVVAIFSAEEVAEIAVVAMASPPHVGI